MDDITVYDGENDPTVFDPLKQAYVWGQLTLNAMVERGQHHTGTNMHSALKKNSNIVLSKPG